MVKRRIYVSVNEKVSASFKAVLHFEGPALSLVGGQVILTGGSLEVGTKFR